LLWFDAGPADGLADTQRCQLARGDVLQATAVAADRRPRPAQDNDLPCISHRKVSCEEISGSPTQLISGQKQLRCRKREGSRGIVRPAFPGRDFPLATPC